MGWYVDIVYSSLTSLIENTPKLCKMLVPWESNWPTPCTHIQNMRRCWADRASYQICQVRQTYHTNELVAELLVSRRPGRRHL